LERSRAGDEASRSDAITSNMALVGFVAARFMGRGYDYEDIYQYGCIGLIKAVDRFDPSYGVAFSTYAVPLIAGEIKRFMRSDGAVHISRTIKENAVKVAAALNSVDGKASLEDVCRITDLNKQDAVMAMSAMAPVRSLSEPVAGDGELTLQDMLGCDDSEMVTDRIALKQALDMLDERERELMMRRYYLRHTQTSIAGELGLSQVQVSRMESKVLKKLRGMMGINTDDGLL
jgi:RNA polymerase sporulation-specific sigma factor